MRERRSLFSQRVTRVSMVVVLDFPSLVTDGVRFAVVGGEGRWAIMFDRCRAQAKPAPVGPKLSGFISSCEERRLSAVCLKEGWPGCGPGFRMSSTALGFGERCW
jgi:hypothetical protein